MAEKKKSLYKIKSENRKREKNRWQRWQRANLLEIARKVIVFDSDVHGQSKYYVHSKTNLLGISAFFKKLLDAGTLME